MFTLEPRGRFAFNLDGDFTPVLARLREESGRLMPAAARSWASGIRRWSDQLKRVLIKMKQVLPGRRSSVCRRWRLL
jgi:hypothetical protein